MRRKRLIKKILDALREPAPLNYNIGPVIRDGNSRHLSHKDKRHSGWVTPRFIKHPGMKYQEAVQEALEPQPFYDDWKDWRDGMRNRYSDATRFKKGYGWYENDFVKDWEKAQHVNRKLRKELAIRRAARMKRFRLNTTS